MLSLICNDIEDETAVAVQRDLNSLERHITAIQLRKTNRQTSIKIFFPSRNPDSHLVLTGINVIGGIGGIGAVIATMEESATLTVALEDLRTLE